MITREEALAFLNEKIKNKNIVKHMIAAEALMGAVYEALKKKGETDFSGTRQEWMMAGLLHDGDYRPEVPVEEQGKRVTEWLREKGYEVPENVAYAMAAHNFHNNQVKPKSKMDWALFCGDSLTGLIVAATLVLPNKELSDLTIENVLRRFAEKRFAAGTRREDIALCEEKLGIDLEEFVKIGLDAMQGVAKDLGL